MKAKGQSFLGGAFTLMLSAAIVKVIGAIFKIPLAAALGGEGMGYYMTAYSAFNPAFALSVAGFSIAVSKLCSVAAAQGRVKEKKLIFAVALIMFPLIGVLLAVIIYISAPFFVVAVDNPAAIKAVRAMAPSMLFCCMSAVFRGYYEGSRNMVPTALSQVMEAISKLVLGLFFAYRCINSAVLQFEDNKTVFGFYAEDMTEAMSIAAPNAAAAAISGVAASTAIGCVLLILYYLFFEKESPSSAKCSITSAMAANALIKTALPVCAGALVVNMASLIDLFSVMNRINHAAALDWNVICRVHPEIILGEIEADRVANFLYGSYTGLAMTVFNLAPALTTSIAVCALPMISAASARGKKAFLRQRIESVIRITIITSVPLGLGMSAMAEPILTALFRGNPFEAAVASRLLRIMGVSAIFVSLSAAINSMLQAVGRIYAPVKLLLIGSLIKLLVNWLLISRPEINIIGAPVGTLCCYLFITLTGTAMLMRSVDDSIGLFPMMAKPIIAGIICCTSAVSALSKLQNLLNYRLAVVASIAVGAAFYLIFLVILGGFSASDLQLLDNNSKMKKLLIICRLFPCKSRYNAVE